MKLGFVGLGNMGAPMARNLLKAGHDLVVFDVVQSNVDVLVKHGEGRATAAATPAAILDAGVDAVVTMLPAAQHVKSVYLGDQGLLSAKVKGVVLIDSSTIDPMSAREVAKAATDKGALMLDAPVSGGTGGAEAGTLTFMGLENHTKVGWLQLLSIITINSWKPIWLNCLVNMMATKKVNKREILFLSKMWSR